ncbi:MAG: UDP-N-acetylmuramate--L-alanine ligase [Oscillospiraceae bacterium]|nr:UDP-N-acetylmuramate--L-alanine ligase [Oscillospiraceae bacterium]
MNKHFFNNRNHIHFIGIGGSGMYPLAQILHSLGYYLTGSDNNDTETLQAVRDMGIPVYLGQRAENIKGADLIVHTAAILPDNPELVAAKESGVEVLERSQLLGIITEQFGNAICVSGTHGKTTVTSMITQILVMRGDDISAVIGGKLPIIHGSGRAGKSDTMVCEACEFQDHFLNLAVDTAVILNVDEDHLDYFKNLDNIIKSFHKFCENTTRTIVINGDDANSQKALEGISGKEIITFGWKPENQWYPENIRHTDKLLTEFTIMHEGKPFCEAALHVPGEHNILNAVAAAATAANAGASPEDVSKGLESFRGAGRRFEKYGESGGITVVDDYAHHPAEIEVTLRAASELGFDRVWAVHQPFTYSRTSLLLEDFAKVLSIADKVVLTSIMGGREKNTLGIHTKDLAEKIPDSIYFDEEDHDPNFELCAQYVCENAAPGDLIITLGCGDVNKLSRRILELLESKYN